MVVLSLVFFSTNISAKPPIDMIQSNLKDFNVVSNSKKSSNTYTYQLNQNQTIKFKLFNISNFNKQYTACLTADAYIVFLDLESKNALDRLEEVVTYIKEYCSYDVKTYVIGRYNKEESRIASLDSCEINNFLNMKNFLYTYIEINNNIESENFESTIRDLFSSVYQNKKNQLDSQCGSIYDTSELDKEDMSKSHCIII